MNISSSESTVTHAKHEPDLSQAQFFFSISKFYGHRKAILETSFLGEGFETK